MGFFGLFVVGLESPARASMVDVIWWAKTVIYAEIPNPSPDVIDALVNAKGRGVGINLIVSGDAPPQRKLTRFGIKVTRREIDTPFVSGDCRVVFIYGQTWISEKEGFNYALQLIADTMRVKPDEEAH